MNKKVVIIGGGISGCISGIKLAQDKTNTVHIIESKPHLLGGSPYCHLHAGGILYPEISQEDAYILLDESILFAKRFKNCLNHRPIIVAYKSISNYCPNSLLSKCQLNKLRYESYSVHPYCRAEDYYASYTREDLLYYKKNKRLPEIPESSPKAIGRKYHDEYMLSFCEYLKDIDSIKYPLISVCEPGIDKDKVEQQISTEIQSLDNITISLNTVCDINNLNEYNVIVNASGRALLNNFENDKNDEKPVYEYKSSFVIKNEFVTMKMAEIAIIGERDTESGMVQITPMSDSEFQIHSMRKESTIIETFVGGFPSPSSYGLTKCDINERTQVAINEIGKYLYGFERSEVSGACPGVQRINGGDKLKRTSAITIKREEDKIYVDILTLKAGSIVSLVEKNLILD